MMQGSIFIVLLLFVAKATCQIVSPCKTNGSETYAIDNDCTKFIVCIEGRPFIVQCVPGQLYSAAVGSCITAAVCPQVTPPTTTTAATTTTSTNSSATTTTTTTTPRPTTTTPRPTTPGITAPCTSTQPDAKEFPNNCKQFYYCYQGTPLVVKCFEGQYFSLTQKGCVTATQCPQTPATTTPATTTTTPRTTVTTTSTTRTTVTTTPATTPTTTTTTAKPPALVPPCTSLTQQAFEIANDCTKFLYCINGSPFVVQCNAGEFFNIKTGTCVKATQCPQGTVTTTPTTTTTTTPRPTTPTTTTTTPRPTIPTTTTTTPRPTTTTTTAKPSICVSNSPATYPYPGDPSQYYYCYNGTALVVKCPSNTIYVAALNGCGPK